MFVYGKAIHDSNGRARGRRYLVSNDIRSAVLKSNKHETCQQKITTQLINERHMLVGCYFYTHISHLLGFDTNDMVSFNTKYFFEVETQMNFLLLLLFKFYEPICKFLGRGGGGKNNYFGLKC